MVPRGVLLSMDGGMGLHSCIAQVNFERKHVIHELNRAKIQVPRISIQYAVDPVEHSRVSGSGPQPPDHALIGSRSPVQQH
uniref:Late blight resistance protein n=1 Tax=Solanum tuberosum TaxID=4113 RepID=M1AVE2_SOLTU